MDCNNYSYVGPGFACYENPDKTPVQDPRVIALDLLYSIPGYKESTLETKNFCYDIVIQKIHAIINNIY